VFHSHWCASPYASAWRCRKALTNLA